MPVKRRRERLEYDSTAFLHLATGDCLLAGHGDGCGCGLKIANGEFQTDIARQLWKSHRAEVLAECRNGSPAWIESQLRRPRR